MQSHNDHSGEKRKRTIETNSNKITQKKKLKMEQHALKGMILGAKISRLEFTSCPIYATIDKPSTLKHRLSDQIVSWHFLLNFSVSEYQKYRYM